MLDEALHRLVRLGFASSGSAFVTIDLDATIIRSFKNECESIYRANTGDVPGERDYQPLIAFCPEVGMVLHAEMCAGNVPASKGNLEALEAVLGRLPQSVEGAMLRTDCAGCQERIIRFCNDPSARPEPRDAEAIVRLAHECCEQGKAVHLMLKSDLAADILPSGRIAPNAAWLRAAAITLNVVALLRVAAMGSEWLRARMKRLRAVWLHHIGMISRRRRRTTLFLPPAARHLVMDLDGLACSRAPP